MNGKSINFEEEKVNKIIFYHNKKLFNIHDIDVNKILASKEESYGTKLRLNSLLDMMMMMMMSLDHYV